MSATKFTSNIWKFLNKAKFPITCTDRIDDLTLCVPSAIISKFKLASSPIIWLSYDNKQRPFLLQQDNYIDKDTIIMSNTAGNNISIKEGANVHLFHKKTPTADFVLLYPVGDDTKGLSGFLLSEFIYPYFSHRICPLHIDDHFTIHAMPGDATLCVLDIGPWDYGIVTPETHIILSASAETIDPVMPLSDPLQLVRRLRKAVDYLSTRNYGRTIADFANNIETLICLLEAPPSYTELEKR